MAELCCFQALQKSRADRRIRPVLQYLAALGLTACHLLYFALLRSASVVAGLEGVLGFALLARSAFRFLAVVFAQLRSISQWLVLYL